MKKILAVISLILVLITFSACSGENYKWDPLPGGPDIKDEIKDGKNSGVAIQKGNYVYMINGAVVDGESGVPTANKFGVPEKGAIYRFKVNNDGSIDESSDVIRMAPKVAYGRNASNGMYISYNGIYIPDNSNKLYYLSPSTVKNRSGSVLFGYTDVFSVNLDGTRTKKLATIEYYFVSKFITIDGRTYFVYEVQDYVDDELIHRIMILDEDGKTSEVASGYLLRGDDGDVLIGDDNCLYYTKSISKGDGEITGDEEYNEVCKKAIIDGTEEPVTLTNGENISELKYNVDLIEFKDGVLYYTKNVPAGTNPKTLYFAYKGGKEYKLNSLETFTKPYFLGFEGLNYKGTLFYAVSSSSSSSSLVLAQADGNNTIYISKLLGEPQYLFYDNEESLIYLIDSGKICSIKIFDEDGIYTKTELSKFKTTIDLERYYPQKIGNYIYFIGIRDEEYLTKYLYRHDITKKDLESDYIPEMVGALSKADKDLKDEAEKDD